MNAKSHNLYLKNPGWLAGVVMGVMLLLSACAPVSAPVPTVAPAPTAVPTAIVMPTAAPVTIDAGIRVATDPQYGPILTDSKGMTLYIYTKDEPDKSNCAAGCLKAWPPLLTLGTPQLGTGVNMALVGSTTLGDGSKIVTYNHMPLYYWAKDARPGDTTGQNVGGVWYVVSADGQAVKTAASSPAATAAPAASDVTLMVGTDPKLGKMLVDGKGMTLYMYTKDGPNQSNCSGGCLKAWPPFLTLGSPKAGDGVDASLIGTAALADGSKIVTYNKLPLYYWASDTRPGDATGQGVGQVWYVISPDGKPVGK